MAGEVWVNGEKVSEQPLYDTAAVVGSVFQNPRSQFFNVDTTSEITFGCENLGQPEKDIRERFAKTVRDFRLEKLMDRNIFHLSGGEKQKIACAGVSIMEPDVLVMDEPSSNLDAASILDLRKILAFWKSQGKTIIVSEHRLYYLVPYADRILYMKHGSIVREFTGTEFQKLSPDELQGMGLRALDLNQLKTEIEDLKHSEHEFAFQNLECKVSGHSVLHIESLQIPAGEIVAVIGHNGAGKSTFAGCLCGIRKHTGKVFYNRTEWNAKKRLKESYMVMQDVNHQLFTESVRDEVTLNIPEGQSEQAENVLQQMGIAELAECHPLALSGGQKQRVAIASALCAGKKILIYDEPTSGLDYESMRCACALIREVSRQAELSLVITHDLEFIMACCTCVLHIDHGTVKAFYPLDNRGKARVKKEFLLQ